MLLLINEWSVVNYLHSSNSNYTFGIISPEKAVSLMYWFESNSTWLLESLIDLTSIDLIALNALLLTTFESGKIFINKARFLLVYNLVSFTYNFRVQLLVKLSSPELFLTSSFLFKSAQWLEREVWDLFGLIAAHNKDLRRIITDYGFEGHPLRKDFPVIGFFELLYNEAFKRIIYAPVEMMQEFRLFKFKQ